MKAQLLTVLLVCLCLAACSKDADQTAKAQSEPPKVQQGRDGDIAFPPDSPQLKQIRVDDVETAEVPADEVTAPGKIETDPNRLSHISLPLVGRVSKTFVKVGDSVKEGQPLLMIDSSDVDTAESNFLQAQAGVTQARALLAKAQADVDRSRDLFEHNAIAKKDVLNTEASMTQAQTALEQAKASEQQAQRRLDILGIKAGQFGQHMVVRAPLAGKILEMNIVPGEFRNDLSAPVITVADLSKVWISSDVPETSIRLVQPGERIAVELSAYPGEQFNGRVTRIADTVDPQTRTIKVRAEISNPNGRLRPEMFGRIRLVDRVQPVPVVPAAAIIQGEGQSMVFQETKPGHFRQVPVTLGGKDGTRIAVLRGLQAGDRVVTDGAMLLKAYTGS